MLPYILSIFCYELLSIGLALCSSWERLNLKVEPEPIYAVNTFPPRLYEVAGPWLCTRSEEEKGKKAPEKVLCAGLEGPEAFACQRLWL